MTTYENPADRLENSPVGQIFPDMVALVREGKCPLCKEPIHPENFRDELSLREYKISGICQQCQDETFGV